MAGGCAPHWRAVKSIQMACAVLASNHGAGQRVDSVGNIMRQSLGAMDGFRLLLIWRARAGAAKNVDGIAACSALASQYAQ